MRSLFFYVTEAQGSFGALDTVANKSQDTFDRQADSA